MLSSGLPGIKLLRSKQKVAAMLAGIFMLANTSVCAQQIAAVQSPRWRPDEPAPFTPKAQEIAKMLGIYPQVERFLELRSRSSPDPDAVREQALLKQELIENVITTLLEVESTKAQIETEASQTRDIKDFLEERRDRAINYNSVANFVSGGVAEILGESLQYKDSLAKHGKTEEIIGGDLQTLFSMLAMREQIGKRYRSSADPNMLAQVFDLYSDSDSQYPAVIWTYINSVPLNSSQGKTRRELMMENWAKLGRISKSKSGKYHRTAEELSGIIPKQHGVTIPVLSHRATMLSDMAAMVAQIDRDLLELMRCIRGSIHRETL